MTKVIVTGHGKYGTLIKDSLSMILGEPKDFFYVDFKPEDDMESLNNKLADTIEQCGNDEIIFTCDLAGGTPFKQAVVLAMRNDKYRVVAGLNTGAYGEIAFMLDKPIEEVMSLAIESAHNSIFRFP
ncbi:MAG: PTS sugar transporter subunit IIA [Clostridiaceae bacterium]